MLVWIITNFTVHLFQSITNNTRRPVLCSNCLIYLLLFQDRHQTSFIICPSCVFASLLPVCYNSGLIQTKTSNSIFKIALTMRSYLFDNQNKMTRLAEEKKLIFFFHSFPCHKLTCYFEEYPRDIISIVNKNHYRNNGKT